MVSSLFKLLCVVKSRQWEGLGMRLTKSHFLQEEELERLQQQQQQEEEDQTMEVDPETGGRTTDV